jgi:hypothetical protein
MTLESDILGVEQAKEIIEIKRSELNDQEAALNAQLKELKAKLKEKEKEDLLIKIKKDGLKVTDHAFYRFLQWNSQFPVDAYKRAISDMFVQEALAAEMVSGKITKGDLTAAIVEGTIVTVYPSK